MIRDLLWACPCCAAEESIARSRGAEVCRACGARYRRVAGAMIACERPGAETVTLSAAEWIQRLPPIMREHEAPDRRSALRRTAVLARFATGYAPVRHGREFLGRVERLGPALPGELQLFADRLVFQAAAGAPREWPLGRITAVQPSSSTLQVKVADEPVVSFRFPDSSPRLWEELLAEVLRRFHREQGRGEIIELQPRITFR